MSICHMARYVFRPLEQPAMDWPPDYNQNQCKACVARLTELRADACRPQAQAANDKAVEGAEEG
jgi:hypothetical protein